MARQGSLCPRICSTIPALAVRRWRYVSTFACLLILLSATSTDLCSSELGGPGDFPVHEPKLETSQGEMLDVRLDCRWTTEESRFWDVQIRLRDPAASDSQLIDLENLSSSRLTTGAFLRSQDQKQITFRPRFRVSDGAARLRVRASRQATIVLEIRSDDRDDSPVKGPILREIPLVELLNGKSSESEADSTDEIDRDRPSDATQVTWSIKRAAGDQLRLAGISKVPVYEPGSKLNLALCSNALSTHPSRELTIQYSLVRASHGDTVLLRRETVSLDEHGNCPPISIEEVAPEAPGIYEVRCEILDEDEMIWARLRKREPAVVRIGRPFLVMKPEGIAADQTNTSWEHVGTIRPSESSWSVGQWLPKPASRFIPGSNTQTPPAELPKTEHVGESISVLKSDKTFQATLPVLRPGIPHKISVRFPSARPVRLAIEIGGIDRRENPDASFVLTEPETLGSTKKWQKYTFVYYPTEEDQIWMTNLSSIPFRFESISVQAGPSHLHESSSRGDPHGVVGISTSEIPDAWNAASQRTTERKAVLHPTDIAWVERVASDVSKRRPLQDCDPATIAMYELWVAVDRLRDHALANGFNALMIPTSSDGRAWYESQAFAPRRNSSHPENHRLGTVLRLLTGCGLDVYIEVCPDQLLTSIETALVEQPTLTRALTRTHEGQDDQYNLLRPIVQQQLAELVGEVHSQCGSWEHFAGISLPCREGDHTELPQAILDDTESLLLFARTMGVAVDPKSLRLWASQDGKQTVENWLHDETQRCYAALARAIPQTPLLLARPRSASARSDEQMIRSPIKQSSLSAQIVPADSLRSGEDQLLSKKASLLQQFTATSVDGGDGAVFLAREDTNAASVMLADNVDIAADVSRVVDRLDPSIVIIDRSLVGRGLQRNLPEVLGGFIASPRASLQPVPPIDSASETVHVRSGHGDGHLFVSLVSAAPWDNEVDIETTDSIQWEIIGAGTTAPSGITSLTETRTRIAVPEGKLVVLRSVRPASEAKIRTWTTRVSGGPEALEAIKRKVTLIVERIGILSEFEPYEALTNGGFEQSGGIGLVGWMHAQHPTGCVRIDDEAPAEGKYSVLLTTDTQATTRTWIVSETIAPPESGRLAVSLACRAESKPDSDPHRIKVSIEASRDGTPIRFTSEFEVPRNGEWGNRDVVLEADGIEESNVESLRLTIDSLSGGRVWIDDVRLHDRFPTAKERAELQSQAFLAVQGLQRGNLTPSGRLLQNHWARHLLTHGPAKNAKRVIEAVQPPKEPPSVAERIRNWIPRPLRF